MRSLAKKYYSNLSGLLVAIRVSAKDGMSLGFSEGIEVAGELILSSVDTGRKLIFIGNGASAAISSHMATDFWKTGGIKAVAFNDSALLTCISNDYGYEHVFEKPMEMFAETGDLLIAISSSGRSENILRAVDTARSKKVRVITLSGFDEANPLFSMGDVNFYVPASTYGHVEVLHHSICHCLLDIIIRHRESEQHEA